MNLIIASYLSSLKKKNFSWRNHKMIRSWKCKNWFKRLIVPSLNWQQAYACRNVKFLHWADRIKFVIICKSESNRKRYFHKLKWRTIMWNMRLMFDSFCMCSVWAVIFPYTDMEQSKSFKQTKFALHKPVWACLMYIVERYVTFTQDCAKRTFNNYVIHFEGLLDSPPYNPT